MGLCAVLWPQNEIEENSKIKKNNGFFTEWVRNGKQRVGEGGTYGHKVFI